MIAQEAVASLGRRTWAFTIDSFLMSLLILVIFYDPIMALAQQMNTATTPEATQEMILAIQQFNRQSLPYIFMIYLLYHTLLIAQSGMTVGKYFARIRVVDAESGEHVTFAQAFGRALMRTVGEMFLLYLTFLPAFFSPLRQTLHDRLARTVVIREAGPAR